MPDERTTARELVDRLVRESNLPDDASREELRRELASHFEESADSPAAMREAITRFGSIADVSRGFRAAYRRGRGLLYAAKVLTSIVAAGAAALALELLPNVRVGVHGTSVGIGHGYLVSACFAGAIVLVLVAAWELDIELLCARLERRPIRLLGAFGALLATIYFGHPLVHGPIAAPLKLVISAAAVGVAVWACTVVIVARIDLAYVRLFQPRSS